jgi:hypothetical protein
VVESGIGILIDDADSARLLGSVWLGMCGLAVANTIRRKRGPWVVWLEPTPSVKP